MRLVYGSLVAEVSTEKVSSAKLTDEKKIVELVNEHQNVCEACPIFAETQGNCPTFPYCPLVKVRQMTVPLYVTGVVQTEKGEKKVYQKGQPCERYNRKRYITQKDGSLVQVQKGDFRGYEVVRDKEGKVNVEERAPFQSSTRTIEITETDLFPTGVATNFLIEATYEIYAKPTKDPIETQRNTRKLYEIVKALAQKKSVVIKSPFVWRRGVYKSWAIILEPILFDDGKFLMTMKTTGANLKWLHPMTVPSEVPAIPLSKAPIVNNLQALTSFLDGVKKTAEVKAKKPKRKVKKLG